MDERGNRTRPTPFPPIGMTSCFLPLVTITCYSLIAFCTRRGNYLRNILPQIQRYLRQPNLATTLKHYVIDDELAGPILRKALPAQGTRVAVVLLPLHLPPHFAQTPGCPTKVALVADSHESPVTGESYLL